jgi:bacillithiol biosynthesis cysteine-adding enzyme BshC
MTLKKTSLAISEHPAIFSDYLYTFEKVSSFFSWHPGNDLEKCLEKRLRNYQFRKEIPEILIRQNREFKNSDKIIQTIEKLRAPNSVAIVSGQQVGLYGGPLYTIYKIITVLKLVNQLTKRYPGWQFVPLFWMEIADSDYQEINHFYLINQTNELVRLGLPEMEDDYRSIYRRTIPTEITQLQTQLSRLFPANEYRDAVLKRAQKIYSPGKFFQTAFAEWLQYLLADYGIPVICPTDESLTRLAQPIYESALKNWQDIQQQFLEGKQLLLQKKYHAQIQLDNEQTLLFYEADDGSRSRIDGQNRDYLIKAPQKDQKITAADLFYRLSEQPERFTPNVALRPLIQDWLLPTLIYVGGPAEISYAAQLKPLYENFRIVQPILYPRARVSLIEAKIEKVIAKFKIDISEIFELRSEWLQHKLQSQSDAQFKRLFEGTGTVIKDEMIKLQESLSKLDQNLEANIQKTTANMLESLDKLRQKTDEAYRRKMDIDINQLSKVLINLFPQGNFQERKVNILQYIIRYGPEFVVKLYDSIDVNDKNHQLIFL